MPDMAMQMRLRIIELFTEEQLRELAKWFVEDSGDIGYNIIDAKILEVYDAG